MMKSKRLGEGAIIPDRMCLQLCVCLEVFSRNIIMHCQKRPNLGPYISPIFAHFTTVQWCWADERILRGEEEVQFDSPHQ